MKAALSFCILPVLCVFSGVEFEIWYQSDAMDIARPIQIQNSAKVHDLKAAIALEGNVPPFFDVQFRGRSMEPEAALADVGIGPESVVHVVDATYDVHYRWWNSEASKQVRVKNTDKVQDLKQAICAHRCQAGMVIVPGEIAISFEGKRLSPRDNLSEMSITSGVEVEVRGVKTLLKIHATVTI